MTQLILFTPTLNAAHRIEQLVDCLNALSDHFDIVQYVGDGGSSDGTCNLIRAFARYPVHIVELPGWNIPKTLNQLRTIAADRHGPATPATVLSADDVLYIDTMQNYLTEYHRHITCGPSEILSGVIDIEVNGRITGQRLAKRDGLEHYMSVNYVGMLTPLSLLCAHPFPEESPNSYDYVWLLRLLDAVPDLGVHIWSDPRPVGRLEFGGISETRRHTAAREILGSELRHGHVLRAVSRYFGFLLKDGLRSTMPRSLLLPAIRSYRMMKGSVDQWST